MGGPSPRLRNIEFNLESERRISLKQRLSEGDFTTETITEIQAQLDAADKLSTRKPGSLGSSGLAPSLTNLGLPDLLNSIEATIGQAESGEGVFGRRQKTRERKRAAAATPTAAAFTSRFSGFGLLGRESLLLPGSQGGSS